MPDSGPEWEVGLPDLRQFFANFTMAELVLHVLVREMSGLSVEAAGDKFSEHSVGRMIKTACDLAKSERDPTRRAEIEEVLHEFGKVKDFRDEIAHGLILGNRLVRSRKFIRALGAGTEAESTEVPTDIAIANQSVQIDWLIERMMRLAGFD
ncbi:MAG: hypothetical protein WC211_06170 [Dehalococcoidia bacterium]